MKGNYLVVKANDDKNILVICSKVCEDKTKLKVRLADKPEEKFIIKRSEVIANLGEAPACGQVYGIKVEPLVETNDDPFWGEIRSYKFFTDNQKELFAASLKRVRKEIQRRKLPSPLVDVELREQKGKMAGMYKYRPSAERDVLQLMAMDSNNEIMDYITSHEYSHGIWYRCMTPKSKMRWVQHYHEGVTVQVADSKQLSRLRKDIVGSGSFSDFLKSDFEDNKLVRAIIRSIGQVHGLTKHHLDMALAVGDDLKEYWPDSIETSEKEVLVTDYAKKSPEELFAEAFSYHFVGRKIPKATAELLDKTLRNLVK